GDVRVLGLPGQPVDPAVVARFGVVPAAEVWRDSPRLPLYQMGNNLHHHPVHEAALERPGVLVLHDLVLHHLVSEETLGQGDFEAYRRRLAADHGWIGEEAALPRAWGAEVVISLFALPAHRTVLRRQRGVLVHNRWAADRIAEDDPEVRVAVVPMAVPLPPAADPGAGRAFRRRHGVPDGAPVLGSFGFQTPIKRTGRVVEALAAPELAGAHLLVVGETVADLDALARELGVADRVHVTGFVPYAELEAAIAACDLGVNLRYPTAGETSASLLRVLAMGRPAVVSDYAQFAELPEEVAVKVALGEGEVAGLVRALADLLADPGRLAAMGEAAREHVRLRHDPAAAAGEVWAACREWADAPPLDGTPGERPAAPPPPTTLVEERLPGEVELDAGADEAAGPDGPAWPEGERRRVAFRVTNHGPARWLAAHRGPGGVALQVSLLTPQGDLLAGRPWLPLPRDLAAGESHRFELDLRRPPGEATLRASVQQAGSSEAGVIETASWGGPAGEWRLGWP
ncbi:MAG TPA: glycosyltransferase family 4 protein, partial [Thermoanaerobaculia bacterium]